jgi:hypothetical protein
MQNPQAALNALNAPAAAPVGGHAVREITLGMAGVLEAIGSPLYNGAQPGTIGGWAPTLYAMTRDPGESRRILAAGGRERFEALAQAWADALAIRTGRRLIEAVTSTLRRLDAVSPDDAGEAGAEGNALAAGPTAG